MSDPLKRIVCINLGTRYLGLAAFQGGDLRDWRVRSFNGRWSSDKEKKIIALNAGMTVIRLLPPLVITYEQIDHLVETLTEVLSTDFETDKRMKADE